jgi:hypothetical protein
LVTDLENILWNARIAVGEKNIGEFNDPAPGTARELFRRLLRLGGGIGTRDWIIMERFAPDYRENQGKQFSAEWIFETVVKHNTIFETLDDWVSYHRRNDTG